MRLKIKLAIAMAAITLAGRADEPAITLDLTKASTPMTFNAETGAWTGTYDDDRTAIESQCFSFMKGSMGAYQTWWGFTASNSADNSRRSVPLTYQFSNMAKGGIALAEDGSVKRDAFGAPVVDASVPYLVAYYMPYMSRRPLGMTFRDGKSYRPVGAWFNLNSWTYYTVEEGDALARAFTHGDTLTVTVHGVAPSGAEATLDIVAASYDNGCLSICRGWRYVDLSALGEVNEIYFTMTTTDRGTYGDNTPMYFCLDKLSVRPGSGGGVPDAEGAGVISYDRRSGRVSASGFVALYDVEGRIVASGHGGIDCSELAAGIYVARCGCETLKFVR